MHRSKYILLVTFSLLCLTFRAQTAIGSWKSYLPFRYGTSVADGGTKMFCGTNSGLFSIDLDDNSYEVYTKVNGLSDNGIKRIRYHQGLGMLVIVYENANIDILENKTFYNVPDIFNKVIAGVKQIYNIDFYGNYAYFSCSFGIVVFDMVKKEFKDTYYIGEQGEHIAVYDLDFYKGKIWAATEKGLFKADQNSEFLSNFETWSKDTSLIKPSSKYTGIASLDNHLFVNQKNDGWAKDTMFVYNDTTWSYFRENQNYMISSVEASNNKLLISGEGMVDVIKPDLTLWRRVFDFFPGSASANQALIQKDSTIWFADANRGLVQNWDNYWTLKYYSPTGPEKNYTYQIDYANGNLWVATGGRDAAYNNIWLREGVYQYNNSSSSWNRYGQYLFPQLDSIFDIVSVIPHPTEAGRAYACSWGKGMYEIRNGGISNIFGRENSTLENLKGVPNYYTLGVGGGTFDNDGNLWVTNSSVNTAINFLKPDGSWRALDCNGFVPDGYIGGITIDNSGQKWVNFVRGGGILVYNDNGTIDNIADDRKVLLNTNVGYGKLPSTFVNCISLDKEGQIWVGTDKGISVFTNPENVFSGSSFDAQEILVFLDGYYQPLFEFENITAIKVDGANRKWVSTSNAGVFLLSPDGTEQLLHFTTENSPLISNNVLSMTINPDNGEVFFACDGGIVSYRGSATEGKESFESVQVWPNPVKENYSGPIAISGLVANAEVHIADISGNIVYSSISNGGQAIWYGNDFNGNRVQTGVYSVFCSDSKGTKTYIAKIMVVN